MNSLQRRIALGLTQRQLSEKAKVTNGDVASAEKGRPISKLKLSRINSVLDGKAAEGHTRFPFKNEAERKFFQGVYRLHHSPLRDKPGPKF